MTYFKSDHFNWGGSERIRQIEHSAERKLAGRREQDGPFEWEMTYEAFSSFQGGVGPTLSAIRSQKPENLTPDRIETLFRRDIEHKLHWANGDVERVLGRYAKDARSKNLSTETVMDGIKEFRPIVHKIAKQIGYDRKQWPPKAA